VPQFTDHNHYIQWMDRQLATGAMRNVRHLWTSVRPNGDNRPHDLNRLEVRICDLIADPLVLLAVMAFTELRLLLLLDSPTDHDPLRASRLDLVELAALADANDQEAARHSLDAKLGHWRSGAPIEAREWIAAELKGMAPLAAELGLTATLRPLTSVLENGNQAMRWLRDHGHGTGIGAILAREAQVLADQEKDLEPTWATDATHCLG
jgi:predicted glutamate--cysteine ligase